MLVKSCPFCGGRPYIEESQRGFVDGQPTKVCYIRCSACNDRSKRVNLTDYGCSSYSRDAVEDVIDAWNIRAENTITYELTGHHKNRAMVVEGA